MIEPLFHCESLHMLENVRGIIMALWLAIGVVWLLTAFRLKPIVRMAASGPRMAQILILACAAELLFSESPRLGLLDARYVPALPTLVALGVALTAAGAAFCILARLYLGQNWSATATIKQDHELIRSGPYGLVRHPIYTGQLIAVIGTATAFGELRDLLALPLALLGFWRKVRSEERLLMSNFGDRYADYRRQVRGAIVPRFL
jgi:protein-S-isoprenylcysteine O-methyltransferase Ste14